MPGHLVFSHAYTDALAPANLIAPGSAMTAVSRYSDPHDYLVMSRW